MDVGGGVDLRIVVEKAEGDRRQQVVTDAETFVREALDDIGRDLGGMMSDACRESILLHVETRLKLYLSSFTSRKPVRKRDEK
jgi:hypothetical protein